MCMPLYCPVRGSIALLTACYCIAGYFTRGISAYVIFVEAVKNYLLKFFPLNSYRVYGCGIYSLVHHLAWFYKHRGQLAGIGMLNSLVLCPTYIWNMQYHILPKQPLKMACSSLVLYYHNLVGYTVAISTSCFTKPASIVLHVDCITMIVHFGNTWQCSWAKGGTSCTPSMPSKVPI